MACSGDSQSAMDFLRGISFGEEEESVLRAHYEKRSAKHSPEEEKTISRSVSKKGSGMLTVDNETFQK